MVYRVINNDLISRLPRNIGEGLEGNTSKVRARYSNSCDGSINDSQKAPCWRIAAQREVVSGGGAASQTRL